MSIAPVTPAVAAATGVAPGAVQAVVLNLTMVDAEGAGYASVWPTGSAMPTVSSANTDLAGQTVANMVTVPVGVDGYVSIFSSVGADYIVDVQGVYESATSASSGRFVPLTPRRAIDTRLSKPLPPNSSITVDVAAVGVPADASAAVLNVTATQTRAGGYLTVWPADTPMPLASNVNVPNAGYTVANQVIARVTNGRVSVYSFAGSDVIVDVTGYMTGAACAHRCRRAVRADHPGPPARHAHRRTAEQRATDRLGQHTARCRSPGAAGYRGAACRPSP